MLEQIVVVLAQHVDDERVRAFHQQAGGPDCAQHDGHCGRIEGTLVDPTSENRVFLVAALCGDDKQTTGDAPQSFSNLNFIFQFFLLLNLNGFYSF